MQTKIKEKDLINEVTINKLTDVEIATKYNCSYITIGNIRRRLKLPCNKRSKKKITCPNREELIRLFNKYGTDSRVANALKIYPHIVKQFRIKYNITIDNYSINAPIQLTHIQKEILFGILLGDGYCRKLKNQKRASFLIDHSIKQKAYVDYIVSFFNDIPGRTYEHITGINKKTNKQYQCYCFSMNENLAFDFFRDNFYINNIKEIPIDLLEEYYTPIAMAFHYMDDGSFSKHTVTIATCGFRADQINLFRAFLLKKYNIETTIYKDKKISIRKKS